MTLTEHLVSIEAPAQFVAWSVGKTAEEAWNSCDNPGWLLFWAGSTEANGSLDGSRSIKLATLDVSSTIAYPNIEPRPEWAKVIAKTWQHSPRDPERVAAWDQWYLWSSQEISGEEEAAFRKRRCDVIRLVRLQIPWTEAGSVLPERTVKE